MKIQWDHLEALALTLVLMIGALNTGSAFASGVRNVAKYNLHSGVGLKGYDPVAVFPQGGSQAQAGRAAIRLNYAGVTYYFANVGNRETFLTGPEKFEPTYGGWCAYAMASGRQVDIMPHLFTISGNRAHFFANARAKRNFDRDISGHETRADDFWKEISGEDPRF